MKKLVILSAFLSPYRSGAEAMVEEVSVRLADQFDVTIVTGRYSRSLPTYDRLGERVKVIRVGLGFGFDKWLYPFLAPLKLGALKPDIIHAVLETFAGLALMFCRCHARKVLTLQTTNRSFLKGMIVRSPDAVTAISNDLVRIAAELGRSDITLIPNGIDLKAINEACAFHSKVPGRILFVGRLESMKGVDILLNAFVRLTPGPSPEGRGENIGKNLHLRIVGDGSEMNVLKSLAKELKIDGRVTFVGRLAGKAVLDEYAAAEIFCGLSRSEALGNVFLEAQAAGCAVLATNVGGIPDSVQDGVTGLLVPPDDIDAAATALKKLVSDSELRKRLADAAKQSKERYDWNLIAKEYEKIYAS